MISDRWRQKIYKKRYNSDWAHATLSSAMKPSLPILVLVCLVWSQAKGQAQSAPAQSLVPTPPGAKASAPAIPVDAASAAPRLTPFPL